MSDAPSILIVDDEPVARIRLRELLGDLAPQFAHAVIGEARTAADALSVIASLQPNIVLLDVQMPGMNGIELARHLSARAAVEHSTPMPAVIFVTAHDEYAVQAFDVRAIDYLLKPVRASRLLEALQRSVLSLPGERREAIDALARDTQTQRRQLSVHERGRVVLVPMVDVIYLKAELKYITVRTSEREFLIEESLTDLEQEFGERFVRIHRNALVARDAITGFERVAPSAQDSGGEPFWQVVMRDIKERLPVSRRQWSTVKALAS
ncbi:MAG: LytR/AlgR family response regulator transcription factor [Quisquiliibacterium sp.]